jgi:carboxypeptidase Taq
MMSLDALDERIRDINDILCAIGLLIWDSRVTMPAGGAETRGAQIATLTRLARDRLVDDATRRALEGAVRETATLPADSLIRRKVEQVGAAVDFHRRIPAELVARRAGLRAVANRAWDAAKSGNDFGIFAPYLEQTIAAARAFADAAGFAEHPYDALIQLYEPGETVKDLRRLFGALRQGLNPILRAALDRPAPRRDFLSRHFPRAGQQALAERLGALFDYDRTRGRIDESGHPFEISLTREDVRITTRYRTDYLPTSLFGTLHEIGHALYEQNVDPAYSRGIFASDLIGLYAVGGTSFGAHESQSRLIENHLGRSLAFWQQHYPLLNEAFPQTLDDVDVSAFYAAVTTTRPGPIRIEADELTYDFHIMLRVELEADLVAGRLRVGEIPEAWNSAMRDGLGVAIAKDGSGCLQDIHWSSGMIGSFCTYTIGNVMAAQLYESALEHVPDLAASLAQGNYRPLLAFLHDAIWRHGRRFSRDELLQKATGNRLALAPYLTYLAGKYAKPV